MKDGRTLQCVSFTRESERVSGLRGGRSCVPENQSHLLLVQQTLLPSQHCRKMQFAHENPGHTGSWYILVCGFALHHGLLTFIFVFSREPEVLPPMGTYGQGEDRLSQVLLRPLLRRWVLCSKSVLFLGSIWNVCVFSHVSKCLSYASSLLVFVNTMWKWHAFVLK